MGVPQKIWARFEDSMVGGLEEGIRRNMRVELSSQVAVGVLSAVAGFLPLVFRRLGGSVEMLALLSASAYLGNILASFGLFLIRPGQAKRLVMLSWVVSRSTFLALALVTNNIALLVLAALFYLADQLPNPAYGAIIQSIYPAADRGKVLAMVRLGTTLPVLILTPLAGWLMDRVGHHLVFFGAGLAGLLGVWLFSRLRVDETTLQVRRNRTMGYAGEILRRDRRFVLYLAGLVVFGLSSLIPSALVPLVQADRIRLSYEQLGWLSLLYGVVRVAFYLFWGRRIDRWGSVRCLQIAFAVNCIYLLPYALATEEWMLIPAFVAQGITNSAIDLGFISAAIQLADPQRVSEYTALQYTVIGARGIVGPFIGVGLLALGAPMPAIFLFGMGLALTSAWLLGRASRPVYAASPARQAGSGPG